MSTKLVVLVLLSLGLSSCVTTQLVDPFSGEYLEDKSKEQRAKETPEKLIFKKINDNQWQLSCADAKACPNLGKTWTVVPSEFLTRILDKKIDVSKIICISDNLQYPSPMLCKVPKDQILRFPITGLVDFPIPTGYAIVGGTPAGILAWAVLKVK
jgi:hypothetical protein